MKTTTHKRSLVLALGAMLANIYLATFSVDALFSVIEEIFRGLTGSLALSALRTVIAGSAVLASVLMIPILVFIPHLPKRAFVPPILFAFWAALGAPPLDLGSAGFALSFGLVLVQLALAGVAYGLIRRQMGQYWLTADRLPIKSKLVLRIAVSAVAVILVAVFVLPALVLSGLRSTIETQTAGYVRFSDTGVEVADRTFRKGDSTVRLIGMVHIGEARFYDDLFDSFSDNSIVLAEGVSDEDKLLEENLSYQRVAQVLGLDQQPALRSRAPETISVSDSQPNRLPITEDSEADSLTETAGVNPSLKGPEVVSADIDLREFSETTIGFLNETAALYASPSLAVAWERLQAISANYPEPDIDIIMEDIVDKRNDRLLAEFERRQENYDVIVIPWGALHMPGIEAAITAKGYELGVEQYRPLVRFDTLIERLRSFRQGSTG